MTQQESDEKLVSRCLGGEPEAFSELVKRYERAVYNLVLRVMGDRTDAQDVHQEVFMNCYRHLQDYDPRYKFSSWLLSIAKNQALYRLRQRRTGSVPVDDLDAAATIPKPGPDDDPHQKAARNEMRETIVSCLDQLPERYRMVLVLRHLLDRTYQEIAEIAEMPLGTVKTNIFLGRRLLRELLEKQRVHP